jgi:alkanesulfonate monooxygenase SsuD/methylene tetrahydromethanopterin reductase-like flavin-dependent oxidoreductase (luciferase family)
MASLKHFGLQFEPQEGMSLDVLLDWCRYAEKKGFGYAFRSDHLLPIRRGETDSPECWISLGALAAITKTLRFGTMVTPTSYRNPALLAKMARTINTFSGGRLILGLGAGWYEREYSAYGYRFPTLSERIDQFDEALKIILPMVKGEKVSFMGKHFSADVEAMPRAENIYFLVGGKHPRIIKKAAELADEWNIYASPIAKYVQCKKVLDSSSSGRTAIVSHTGVVVVAEDRRQLIQAVKKRQRTDVDPDKEIGRLVAEGIFCGTPSEVVAQINERKDLGVSRFYLEVADMETKEMADLLTETIKEV